ncbi:MAG TPA: response regulator transcription factor [Bacteroidales bacterium]|nr:response regulator transcription factor [Bacteroidales bacterium]
MKKLIKILLVDDHQIIRDGLANMLNDITDVIVCGGAPDVGGALELIDELHPDVVITDLSLPGKPGTELIHKITQHYPGIRVLVLSMYVTEDYIFNALKAGARGYLPKQDTTKAELVKAIRTVFRGEEYFSDSIAQILSKQYSQTARSAANQDTVTRKMTLTSRETEILRLYAEGLSNQEIAEKLNISIRTVETHKNNIMQKYNFRSTVDMVKFAIRNRLTEI